MEPTQKQLEKAREILKKGGIVIFPTDTTFVVGCRADGEEVIERLFNLRKRPKTQPVLILVDSFKMAQDYLLPLPKEVESLMKKYWLQGTLTVIYFCRQEKVPSLIRGGGDTLGVRLPNHKIPLELIKGLGVPLLGPSANFHGEQTPYKYEDLDPEFLKEVDYVLPGQCPVGMVSTVIDCSQKPWEIIRQGAVEVNIN